MPQTEVEILGIRAASLLSLLMDNDDEEIIGSQEDDLLGLLALKEISGRRLIILPLSTTQANELVELYRKRSAKDYTVKRILNEIFGERRWRYDKKKIILQRILLFSKNEKLQTELSIKEFGAFEIDKYLCELMPAIILHIINQTRIFVDDELFDLWVNLDLTTRKAEPGSPEEQQQGTLRERLKRINPEDFGNYQL